jgi:NADH-quinone oxidoreductase subunit A
MKNYWYFFLFFVISIIYAAGLLAVLSILRYRRNVYGAKALPYECGVDPATPTARESYSIRFYLLTLVFIVFEVETFLLFPWAVIHEQLALFGLVEVIFFLGILGLGYIYAWKAEALDFRRGHD